MIGHKILMENINLSWGSPTYPLPYAMFESHIMFIKSFCRISHDTGFLWCVVCADK